MKTVTILGASGSIGTNAVEFLRMHPAAFRLHAVTVESNWQAAAALAAEFGLRRVAVRDAEAAAALRRHDPGLDVLDGDEGVVEAAGDGANVVLAAISGSAGLPSVLAAIRAGSRLALANKEALVCGGPALLRLAAERGVAALPVDSEHSAIYQCLLSGKPAEVLSLLLTASGGPFRFASLDEMRRATPAAALAHPNWPMGAKNSLDSATLANKGLELIEACYFFDIAESAVDVVINPSSILHSAVRFVDGSMVAQLGHADMRVPIGYALSWPDRLATGVEPLDLASLGELRFWPPDRARFPALDLARRAVREGQGGTLLFNAANEVAGRAFMEGKVGFMDIPLLIERCLDAGGGRFASGLDEVLEADRQAKLFCAEQVRRCADAA